MDTPSFLEANQQRLQSARSAMGKLGLPVSDRLFIQGSVEEQVQQLLDLRPLPDVVFFASGIHRFTAIFEALNGTALDLHHTLVAAYDEDLWLQIAPVGIEHVRIDQPLRELVHLAFDSLERLIEQPGLEIVSETRPSRIVHVNAQGDVRPVHDDA
jgi:DNA-binding LacI/PurR family transcriptional regulator